MTTTTNKRTDRRNAHEGTLETVKSGKVRYRGKVGGVRVSGGAFATKKEALADFRGKVDKETARQKAARTGSKTLDLDRSRILLVDFCRATVEGRYQDRVDAGKMSERTWVLYEGIVSNHLDGDPLGETPMGEVDYVDVEDWSRRLKVPAKLDDAGGIVSSARAMKPASRVRYLGFLSGVFEVARREAVVASNPVRDAEKPAVDPDEVDFRILSLPECGELLRLLGEWEDRQDTVARPKAGPRPDHIRGRLIMAAYLGLHGFGPGEMCGMRKEDFEEGGLTPRQQGQRGKLVQRLKTKRRKSWVPLDDGLLALVQAAPSGLLLRADAAGRKPVGENNLRRAFNSALSGTEFEGLKLYDLRHTFAMRLLEEGVDIRTVAELMRHTPEVCLRRYVRSREELKREGVRLALRGKITHGDNPQERLAA